MQVEYGALGAAAQRMEAAAALALSVQQGSWRAGVDPGRPDLVRALEQFATRWAPGAGSLAQHLDDLASLLRAASLHYRATDVGIAR